MGRKRGIQTAAKALLDCRVTSVTEVAEIRWTAISATWQPTSMANIAAKPALAPAGVIIGPLVTHGGSRYWYLACFPDAIVAVRQGLGAVFVLGMANDDGLMMPGLFGLAGLLVNHLLKPKARVFRLRMETTLRNTPTSQLHSKPNIVHDVAQLKAIKCVAKKGAPLILPELILESKNGNKQKFGVRPAEFKKACEYLKQMYPALCQLV
jgi:hypothetical protein